jgi:molybdopterin-guanine dinucleotide biosynthesis protein A
MRPIRSNALEAFILIGGRSSRLGTDKACAELGGETLLERAVDVVRRGLSPQRIAMVAGSSTQFAIEAIKSSAPFIFDLHEGRGPIGGLHAALAYSRTPWIFVLACDYPFVTPKLLELLCGSISDEVNAIVPEQADGRMQPLCAFYRVEAAVPVIEAILESPRVAPPMYEVVEMLGPCVVKPESYRHLPGADAFFWNINTPADLERARSRAGDSLRM